MVWCVGRGSVVWCGVWVCAEGVWCGVWVCAEEEEGRTDNCRRSDYIGLYNSIFLAHAQRERWLDCVCVCVCVCARMDGISVCMGVCECKLMAIVSWLEDWWGEGELRKDTG